MQCYLMDTAAIESSPGYCWGIYISTLHRRAKYQRLISSVRWPRAPSNRSRMVSDPFSHKVARSSDRGEVMESDILARLRTDPGLAVCNS
jgi:hypothetical protein